MRVHVGLRELNSALVIVAAIVSGCVGIGSAESPSNAVATSPGAFAPAASASPSMFLQSLSPSPDGPAQSSDGNLGAASPSKFAQPTPSRTLAPVVPTASPSTTVAGDERSDPIVIGGLPHFASLFNRPATARASDPACGDNGLRTLWLTYTATESGDLGASVFGGNQFDAALVVAELAADGSLSSIMCNDDSEVDAEYAAIRFDAVAGTTYVFMLSREDEGPGRYDFEIKSAPVPTLAIDVTSGMYDEGSILIRGTASCSPRADQFFIEFRVRQETAAGDVDGRAFEYLETCTPGGTNWAIPVGAAHGTFRYVHTYVTAQLSTWDPFGEYIATDDAEIPFENDPLPSPSPSPSPSV